MVSPREADLSHTTTLGDMSTLSRSDVPIVHASCGVAHCLSSNAALRQQGHEGFAVATLRLVPVKEGLLGLLTRRCRGWATVPGRFCSRTGVVIAWRVWRSWVPTHE